MENSRLFKVLVVAIALQSSSLVLSMGKDDKSAKESWVDWAVNKKQQSVQLVRNNKGKIALAALSLVAAYKVYKNGGVKKSASDVSAWIATKNPFTKQVAPAAAAKNATATSVGLWQRFCNKLGYNITVKVEKA